MNKSDVKWWRRWVEPSTPIVEVGIVVNMFLILIGGMILFFGLMGADFPSSDHPFPQIATITIGLSIIVICIALSKFLINREADDYHFRIAKDAPRKIRKRR